MSDTISCTCGTQYRVNPQSAGWQIRCRTCGRTVTLRADSGASRSATAPRQSKPPTPTAEPSRVIYRPTPDRLALADELAYGDARPPRPEPGIPHDEKFLGIIAPEAFASKPGEMRASLLRHLATYPAVPCLLLAAFLLSWFIARWLHAYPIMTAAYLMSWAIPYVALIRWRFRHGCILPGRIIADSPWRIATYTDLSNGSDDQVYGAIRISRLPLRTFRGEPAVGQHVAMISCYQRYFIPGETPPPHWISFYPEPIACSATSMDDHDHALARLTATDWAQLDDALRQVPSNAQEGLFTLWDDNELGIFVNRTDRTDEIYRAPRTVAIYASLILLDAAIFWLCGRWSG